MDRHTVVTIALTAAITTTVSAVIKWLWAWFKNKAASETTKAKVRKTFNKTVGKLSLELFMSVSSAGYLIWEAITPAPLTRLAVLAMIFWTIATTFWFAALIFHISYLRAMRKLSKDKSNPLVS
jgi:hypothetical protein